MGEYGPIGSFFPLPKGESLGNKSGGFHRLQVRYTQGGRNIASKALGSGKWLYRLGITPNRVTVAGALICLAACVLWTFQADHKWCYWAAIPIFVFGALLDVLDGAIARFMYMDSPFGEMLDSITDRVVEGGMFAAFALVLARQGSIGGVVCSVTALTGAFLVTYIRAKSEVLGLENKGSIGSRLERLILIGLGALVTPWIGGLQLVVYAANLQVWVAVGQRMNSLYKQMGPSKKAES